MGRSSGSSRVSKCGGPWRPLFSQMLGEAAPRSYLGVQGALRSASILFGFALQLLTELPPRLLQLI